MFIVYILFRISLFVIMPFISIGAMVDALKTNDNFKDFFKYWFKQTAIVYRELVYYAKKEVNDG